MQLERIPGRRRSSRSVWTIVGTVLAVVLGVAGLTVVGIIVFAVVALNNYGSNK
jgi:hypothetical protein